MQTFNDRDFLQTKENLFFCVIGPHHPPDKTIAYLKYISAKKGLWKKGNKKFQRVMRTYTIPNLIETFNLLKTKYPHYLFHSTHYNITLTAVPHQYITKHFKPPKKLEKLRNTKKLDPLQQKLLNLCELLTEKSGVPQTSLGVTGSILLDIHNPKFSDIDITVYGLKNSLALKKALTETHPKNSPLKRFKTTEVQSWLRKKIREHPLTLQDAMKIYKRKWNIGTFQNTRFSIHPIKPQNEVREKYGDKTYYPLGQITIRAVVKENRDYLFLPAVYRVHKVNILNGPSSNTLNIKEIVSYESLYDSLAEIGESIIAKGKLERVVENRTGIEYHRVLVGSPEGKGNEFIKLV